MSDMVLPLTVWMTTAAARGRERAHEAWESFCDDRGVDEAVSKMIWLAVAVGLAIAAGAFVVSTFGSASESVPDVNVPIATTP